LVGLVSLVGLMLGAACNSQNGAGSSKAGAGGSTHGSTSNGTTTSSSAGGDAFVVQEWGTYTSVQASDGHALGGVHHVDEALPTWVHQRNLTDPQNYFFEALPEEPLQQLETPVLYFWSAEPREVPVDVSFPQGIVGEWFPDATTFSPAIAEGGGPSQLTAIANGSMTWKLSVDPGIPPSSYLAVSPDEIWAPSRNVASTPVKYQAPGSAITESEQFLFYRGLGTFSPDVHVVADLGGTLHVENASADPIDKVFLLRATPTGGAIEELPAIAAGSEDTVTAPTNLQSVDAYKSDARTKLKSALVGTGLNADVAQAMVDTWTRSWFGNEGMRVLYLAPRKWTDGWLPTTVTPAPSTYVRTLVGRIEVITPEEENALVSTLHTNASTNAPMDLSTLGRFAEPRLRRAREMLTSSGDQAYADQQIAAAHAKP